MKKPDKIRSIKDLSKRTIFKGNFELYWYDDVATKEEREYIRLLKKGKDILDYRKQREEDVFLDNI